MIIEYNMTGLYLGNETSPLTPSPSGEGEVRFLERANALSNSPDRTGKLERERGRGKGYHITELYVKIPIYTSGGLLWKISNVLAS
jgi:hypothetical protein